MDACGRMAQWREVESWIELDCTGKTPKFACFLEVFRETKEDPQLGGPAIGCFLGLLVDLALKSRVQKGPFSKQNQESRLASRVLY